jgi:hypothetical protein
MSWNVITAERLRATFAVLLCMLPPPAFGPKRILKILLRHGRPWLRPTVIPSKRMYRNNTHVLFCNNPKRRANPGVPLEGKPRFAQRRAKNTKIRCDCGRWAVLSNLCSASDFRSRTGVPLRLSAPLVCSGPERELLVCPSESVRRRDPYRQESCQREVVVP